MEMEMESGKLMKKWWSFFELRRITNPFGSNKTRFFQQRLFFFPAHETQINLINSNGGCGMLAFMIDEDDDWINCTNWIRILIIILVIQINNIIFNICVMLIILHCFQTKRKKEEKSNKIIMNVIYISNLIFSAVWLNLRTSTFLCSNSVDD